MQGTVVVVGVEDVVQTEVGGNVVFDHPQSVSDSPPRNTRISREMETGIRHTGKLMVVRFTECWGAEA